jgi:hypothetical protein
MATRNSFAAEYVAVVDLVLPPALISPGLHPHVNPYAVPRRIAGPATHSR